MHCRIRLRAATTPVVLTLAGATAALGSLHPIDTAAAAGPSPRPNLVFVLADDLGWSDLSTARTNGRHANDFNETPTIDRLAEEGQAFTEAYASAQCSPTRMALHTGQHSTRPTNNVYAVSGIRGKDTNPLRGVRQGRLAEDGSNAIPTSHVTVAETLQRSGYATGYTGKFHVTGSPAEIVDHHGFDESWGGGPNSHATSYFATDGRFNDTVAPELDLFAGEYTEEYVDRNVAPYSHGVPDGELAALIGTDKHVTDAVTDATIDFMERNKDEPFLAWVGQFAPHFPVNDAQARPDLLSKYRAKTPGRDPAKPSYAALIEGVDQSVARIVDYLENTPDPRNDDRPLADNTLLIFTSDNGGKTSVGSLNAPLRGEKRRVSEGGVRVPWVAWSTSSDLVRRGGQVNRTIVNSTDLYRTLAAYAGAELPRGVPLDGIDLRPAVRDGVRIDRRHYYHRPGYVDQDGPVSSVRDGRWKLYYTYANRRFTLYDLQGDIGETTDLAKQRPRTVRRLGRSLLKWLDATDAPLATVRRGHPKVVVKKITGRTYADGRIQRHYKARLVIKRGDEVPFVLPEPPTKKQKKKAAAEKRKKKAAAKKKALAKKKAKKAKKKAAAKARRQQ